jgi:DNA (cytosine-5)-methyltransferase 1
VPYHLYWQVLNAKHHGVPQNRERVFLIGIRDDADNKFQFPRKEHLTKRLKDVLEKEVLKKFYLSDVAIEKCLKSEANKNMLIKEVSDISKCIVAGYYKISFDGQYIKVESNLEKYYLSEKMINGFLSHNKRHIEEKGQDGFNWKPKDESQIANCLRANAALCATDNSIKVKSATIKGYEKAQEGDSINFSVPNSETRRGRVGKGVAQTLDTGCNQGVMVCTFGRSEEEKKRRKEHFQKTGKDSGSFKDKELILKNQEYYDTILANPNPQKEGLISTNYKIRRLTPRECFRLMDFPDTFTWPVSDSQAYKQAGNSIVVNVLYKILQNLSL